MENYKALLIHISQDIVNSDFETMKFYCNTHIGDGILEKLLQPIHLFRELEKRKLLGPTQKDFLAELLCKVGRTDLKNKLLGIVEVESRSRSTVPNAPIVTGTLKETHLGDISEKLPRDWKQLGRKLGIDSNKIDNIDEDCRTVKEKANRLLSWWKREIGGEATGQALSDALTLIGRKDVAEYLADICQRDSENVAQAHNSPAENMENQGDSLETLPKNLIGALPTQEIDLVADDTLTDGAQPAHPGENVNKPIQDTVSPTTQSLCGILDPDKYVVNKQIGSGSCAKVYWCQTKDRSCNYAVKHVDLGMNNKETQEQVKHLMKEIDILQKLRHPYIVGYHFSENTPRALSIFMEYVSGGSISDYIMENGEMQEKCVRKYSYQMLKGCEYLHKNDVIHRDIKGANVLLDSNKNIKLADFGIAKDLQSVVTSTGSTTKGICGTIYWCSPEHFKDLTPTYVLDIWSVGCTVVEMLTSKPPNRHLNYFQAYSNIINRQVYPPDHLSSLAKTFIELCFKDMTERPNATDLLKNGFPTEIELSDEDNEL